MKSYTPAVWMAAFSICLLGARTSAAQEKADPAKLEAQLKVLREQFENQQREMRDNFEKMIRAQQAQIDLLKQQLQESRTNTFAGTNAAPATAPAPAISDNGAASKGTPWSPAAPIQFGGTANYINVSFDGLFAAGTSSANDVPKLQLGGHDPKERGFTVQNLEAVLEGKVDPYFRAQGNLVFQIDPRGDTTVEAEEAYLESMSLPWNLQLKAGQFFTEFGRMNPTHPHTWDFVDQPLVVGRFLGEDGLRSAGARLSWLMPTPFYSELFMTIANSQGGTAFSFRNEHEGALFFGRPHAEGRVKSFSDMLFVPRYAVSFDLTDTQTLLAGASGAFGPNGSGDLADTQIYGVDLFWKWKSAQHHAGFPFVTFQTEAMTRRYEASAFNSDLNANGALNPGEIANPLTGLPYFLPRENVRDYGLYSQVAYGFRKGWVAALRGDYVFPESRAIYEGILGRDLERASRWRISPNLTWYPSEFSKIRLQYNYDRRNGLGDDHSIWLQFEFLLGAHAAHKF